MINLTEAKSSSTASLTTNQQKAFPQLAESGGIVVGQGKGVFTGGTIIPPTEVTIVRPNNLPTPSVNVIPYFPMLADGNNR
jgi:hypothetical protein